MRRRLVWRGSRLLPDAADGQQIERPKSRFRANCQDTNGAFGLRCQVVQACTGAHSMTALDQEIGAVQSPLRDDLAQALEEGE